MRRRLLTGSCTAALVLLAACGGGSSVGGSSGTEQDELSCSALIGQPVGPSSDGETLDSFPGCDVNGATFKEPGSNGCYKNGAQAGVFFWIADVMAGAPDGTWQQVEEGMSTSEMATLVGCT